VGSTGAVGTGLDATDLSSDTDKRDTTPPPGPDGRPAGDERGRLPRSRWRGLTGALAAGLVVLALVVLGSGVLALITGTPGPAVFMLVGHPVAAVLALVAQRFVDTKRRRVAGVAAVAVLAITAATLWLFWWA
jgi:hypothetical protein